MESETDLAGSIKRLMTARGFNQKSLAMAAGLNETAVRDILKGRSQSPRVETIRKLARVLGLSVSELLGEGSGGMELTPLQYVEVIGAVQAGQWGESYEWPHDERYAVPSPKLPPEYKNPRAAEVRGNSMNLVYPNGTVVIFMSLGDYPHAIEHGDHVIVQRRDRSGLYEVTVKELRVDEQGRKWLWPRSDDPEFQQPIPLPQTEAGDNGIAGAAEAQILAVVIAFAGLRRK